MPGPGGQGQQPLAAGAIRQVFAADSAAEARACLVEVTVALEQTVPKVGHLLEEAEDDRLTFTAFSRERWGKVL